MKKRKGLKTRKKARKEKVFIDDSINKNIKKEGKMARRRKPHRGRIKR